MTTLLRRRRSLGAASVVPPTIIQNGDSGTPLIASGTAVTILNAAGSAISDFTTGNGLAIRVWGNKDNATDITSVTVGGQSATKLSSLFETSGYGYLGYWYIESYSGTVTNQVTAVSAAGDEWQCAVTELPSGGTPILSDTAQGTANPVSISLTPHAANNFIDVWQTSVNGSSVNPSSPWFDWYTNFTTNLSNNGAGSDIAYQWATSTSAVTATWTEYGSTPWSIIGVEWEYTSAPSGLPFLLGTNGDNVIYSVDDAGLTIAQGIGMKIWRDPVPWTTVAGQGTGFESTPGTYDATVITAAATEAAAVAAHGMTSMFTMVTNQSPGICPTLSSALSTGGAITSLPTTALIYAVDSGDSIVITSPDQAHTQTFTASSGASAGATSIPVDSQTPNFAYPTKTTSSCGSWVYDSTRWVACTPQHFANAMEYFVGQMVTAGHSGLYYGLFNEPSGESWYIDPTMVAKCLELAYPVMKTADSTCTILGVCIEDCAPGPASNYPQGIAYYQEVWAATGAAYWDLLECHQYPQASSGNLDCPPNTDNTYGYTYSQMIGNLHEAQIALGDTTGIALTEFGWGSSNAGGSTLTEADQNTYYDELLTTFSGMDTTNDVEFSSYLKLVCQYEMDGSDYSTWGGVDYYWAIAPSDTPNTVVATLTSLVAG